jgi:DNA polymerase-3 subunit alpha
MDTIACTEHGSLNTAMDFYFQCKENNIKPILGIELYIYNEEFHDNNITIEEWEYLKQLKESLINGYDTKKICHLLLLAKNFKGYQNLCKISSIGSNHLFRGKNTNYLNDVISNKDDIICLSACMGGLITANILNEDYWSALSYLKKFKEEFKDDFYIEIQHHNCKLQYECNIILCKLAERYNIKVVSTCDSHYAHEEDSELHEIMVSINTGSRFKMDREFWIRSYKEALEIVTEEPLLNTLEIGSKCNIEFTPQLLMPQYPCENASKLLKQITYEALDKLKLEKNIDYNTYKDRLDHELNVIDQITMAPYFLIVWDYVKYCRDNNIMTGPSRGSCAGSICCNLLGITSKYLDPIEHELSFSRFLSLGRGAVELPNFGLGEYLKC